MPKVIGGSAHGKIYEAPRDYIVVASMAEPRPMYSYSVEDAISPRAVDIKKETYKRAKIAGESRVHEVFVPEGWDGDRLIEELIRRA